MPPTDSLPLTDTIAPADQAALIVAVRQAHDSRTPLYPIGGGTSLDYGLPARQPGLGLSLAKLDRVIDYPARDMTITVEAGITLANLAKTLAAEGQRLPLDVPQADRATLGGVIATNFSGTLRYGHGTVRDYVIGIAAVDGRGTPFKGGGRVVKNVAGYDFCKLLTGSLGTIGVITQVTLKVKPLPQAQRAGLLAGSTDESRMPNGCWRALVASKVTPAAIELLVGPAWNDDPALEPLGGGEFGHLVVALEGTAVEVGWMLEALASEWRELGAAAQTIAAEQDDALWSRLREFPTGLPLPLGEGLPAVSLPNGGKGASPLVVKLQRVPAEPDAGNGRSMLREAQAGLFHPSPRGQRDW